MSKFINASYSFWLLVLGPLAFITLLGPWIDRQFPVVNPFVVAETGCEQDCVVISGWMEKRRDCKLMEVWARHTINGKLPRIVEIQFLDRKKPELITRPVGSQSWGPWLIKLDQPGGTVEIHAIHECHPLWDTKSVLATVKVPEK